MAEIFSIEMKENSLMINLKITKSEYELLGNKTSNILLIPSSQDSFNLLLTTGRLGNSNRLMLPKKVLDKFEVKDLDKKVPAKVFKVDDEVYLLVKIKKSIFGIPNFKEVKTI